MLCPRKGERECEYQALLARLIQESQPGKMRDGRCSFRGKDDQAP